jgi:hypothetical protein
MTNAVFCDVTRCGSCKNRDVSEERSASIIWVTRIGELGTLAVTSSGYVTPKRRFLQEPHHFLHSVFLLLVTANVVPSCRPLSSR